MVEKTKVVLDTNVWVSIFMKKVLGREFAKVFGRKDVEICVSDAILKEICRVLVYPKIRKLLKASNVTVKEIVHVILENSVLVRPSLKLNVIREDPEDNRVLGCAVYVNARFIVSVDKHLLNLKKYDDIVIITPKEFLERVG
ncbi:MAG: putative toxin-antitoxin system toxin component, PIN family [Thermoprotei archaeon]|nr:MAG: putative toxin-antitoxin system toxin component, PIN family [Thermoprotei archaeon]